MSCNFGYMGRSNPWVIFTKCGMWADMVDVITCAIFGDCRLSGVDVVRGVVLPSPIDLIYRPYNTGLVTLPCDCVIWRPSASLNLKKSYLVA